MAPSKQRSGGDARPLGILDTGMVRRGDLTSMTRPELARTRDVLRVATRIRTVAHRWRAVCRSRCDGPARVGRARVASEPPPCCARFTVTLPNGPSRVPGGRGLRRQPRRGHDVRPESPPPPVLPQGSSGGSEPRCRGPAEPPPVSGRRGSSRPSSCARARSGVVPAGKSHPRAQPRLSGLARSSPHRLVRTPTATVRTHDGPVPREGPGGGCLLAAASAAPWGRQRDDGREAPGREAQESNGHGAPATEGHRNGCSYGARP